MNNGMKLHTSTSEMATTRTLAHYHQKNAENRVEILCVTMLQTLRMEDLQSHFVATGGQFQRVCVASSASSTSKVLQCCSHQSCNRRGEQAGVSGDQIGDSGWPLDGIGSAVKFPGTGKRSASAPCCNEDCRRQATSMARRLRPM
jgi:hypothetical protein